MKTLAFAISIGFLIVSGWGGILKVECKHIRCEKNPTRVCT